MKWAKRDEPPTQEQLESYALFTARSLVAIFGLEGVYERGLVAKPDRWIEAVRRELANENAQI